MKFTETYLPTIRLTRFNLITMKNVVQAYRPARLCLKPHIAIACPHCPLHDESFLHHAAEVADIRGKDHKAFFYACPSCSTLFYALKLWSHMKYSKVIKRA